MTEAITQMSVADAKTRLNLDKDAVIMANNAIAEWRKKHEALVDAGADETVLYESHKVHAGLQLVMQDYCGKVERGEQRVLAALQAEASRGDSESKSNTERLLREEAKAAEALQSDLDDVIASIFELGELRRRVHAAMPERAHKQLPLKRLTEELFLSIDQFLFAHTGGAIGDGKGDKPAMAAKRATVIDRSKQFAQSVGNCFRSEQ